MYRNLPKLIILTLCALTTASAAAEPALAVKGELLFADDMSKPRGKKATELTNGWKVRAGQGLWEKRDGVYRSTWKPGVGHTPVMAFVGKQQDMVIELTFRYGPMDPTIDWHSHCMRIAVDNRMLYTGHVLSAWANPNNDFIETGFLLQHIRKKPDKTVVNDLLLDRQPLAVDSEQWYVATLEVVGDEALFRMGEHIAYAKLSELAVDKTTISITLGKTWHEIKRVRVWAAEPSPTWSAAKSKVLAKRQPFTPQKHSYTKPVAK
jgi:hypothetical protein